ncbi:S-layer homology domain-containing protein, partial [Paenibacillus sepulcri]|nr:S-layer homology domain-containing protein [Paenibacillus sepulcri]
MRVLRKSRHAVCIALSFVLLVCMAGLPVNAAPSNAEAAPINVETAPINVETALTEFTVTISLTEKEKYAGVEMSVELSDGIKYVSHEMEPSFTSLYQYNGTRHLIGGMTTEGKNVFSGKLEVGVLKLNYQGNANETISISPAVSRYDGDGKPVSTPKKEQTIQISRPGSEANPGGENSGTGGSSGGGKTIILDEQNANIEIVLDDAVPLAGLPSFTDISGHWAESYILSLAAQQVVSGVRNGKFSPNGKLT